MLKRQPPCRRCTSSVSLLRSALPPIGEDSAPLPLHRNSAGKEVRVGADRLGLHAMTELPWTAYKTLTAARLVQPGFASELTNIRDRLLKF